MYEYMYMHVYAYILIYAPICIHGDIYSHRSIHAVLNFELITNCILYLIYFNYLQHTSLRGSRIDNCARAQPVTPRNILTHIQLA